MPYLPFVTSDRNRAPDAHDQRPIARSSASVLSFRARQTALEPEDARITGATRSLYRRLLALNLRKPAAGARETEAFMPPLTA